MLIFLVDEGHNLTDIPEFWSSISHVTRGRFPFPGLRCRTCSAPFKGRVQRALVWVCGWPQRGGVRVIDAGWSLCSGLCSVTFSERARFFLSRGGFLTLLGA